MSKDNFKIMATNFQLIINKNYKNINDFCVANNQDYSAVYRYLNGKLNIGNIMAKRIESIFNLFAGQLDKPIKSYSNLPFNIYSTVGNFNTIDDIRAQNYITTCFVNEDEISSLCNNTDNLIGLKINSDAMHPNLKDKWFILFDIEDNKSISEGNLYTFIFNKRVYF